MAFQNRHGYVVCSFLFLLVGLACFASSVNLLVLRFMILSLEEEEEGELQVCSQHKRAYIWCGRSEAMEMASNSLSVCKSVRAYLGDLRTLLKTL